MNFSKTLPLVDFIVSKGASSLDILVLTCLAELLRKLKNFLQNYPFLGLHQKKVNLLTWYTPAEQTTVKIPSR